MFQWLKELLDIRAEYKARKRDFAQCESCENLRDEVRSLREERNRLLDTVLEKPEPIIEKVERPQPILQRNHMPWRVRQQTLEREDREKAKLAQAKAREDKELNTNDKELKEFEGELLAAEQRRENAGTAQS